MVARKTFRRKTYKKKPSWYNKKYTFSASPMQVAQSALRATRYLKGLVNSEMYHVDTSLNLGSAQSKIFSLCDIAQNDTDSGRTGNSILLRSIYIRGLIEINPAVTANSRVLICVVQDTQQVGDSTPVILDVFKTNSPESMLAMNSAGRFKVLYRKTYVLSPSSGGRNAVEFNKYFSMRQHVRYNGPANTDIQKNGYYLLVLTSEVTNFPTVSLTSRIGYHDN